MMTAKQLAGSRERLRSFWAEMLPPLGRKDRQHWGGVYLRGLLLDGERKSVGAMAERLPELMSAGGKCCLVFTPKLNEWMGQRSVDLEIADFQAGNSAALREAEVFSYMPTGAVAWLPRISGCLRLGEAAGTGPGAGCCRRAG